MTTMATVSFTTRIDAGLKSRLEEIAQYEDRSASYIANQAIRSLVEERDATKELIKTGLAVFEKTGASISASAVNTWLESEDDMPFPAPDTFE